MELKELAGMHKGKICTIVGCGPSIQELTEKSFHKDEILITLNDAVVKVESLKIKNTIYSMQKDLGIIRPTRAILLVSRHESFDAFQDYSPRHVFDAIELFEGKNQFGYQEFSANCAIKIAKIFGCVRLKMLGFDSFTKGDCRKFFLDGTIHMDLYPEAYGQQCDRMLKLLLQEYDTDFSFI